MMGCLYHISSWVPDPRVGTISPSPFVCYTVYHRTSPSVGRSESAPSFSLFSIGSNEY